MVLMNANFASELNGWRNNSDLISGVVHAAGVKTLEELADPMLISVTGYWIDPGEQVFAVWVLSPSTLIIHERAMDGQTFTLAIPLSRIRRVVEQRNSQELIFTVEIEADRIALNISGAGDDEGNLSLSGSALHSGYTITASTSDMARLARLIDFARVSRNCII